MVLAGVALEEAVVVDDGNSCFTHTFERSLNDLKKVKLKYNIIPGKKAMDSFFEPSFGTSNL